VAPAGNRTAFSFLFFFLIVHFYFPFISFFLVVNILVYILVFIIIFYLLPLVWSQGLKKIGKRLLKSVLRSQLFFMRETYLTRLSGKRRAFHFFSMFVGLIFARVLDLPFIVLTYLLFIFLNSVIILYGSNKNSVIWNFYVNYVGYSEVVGIVGNPLSALLGKFIGSAGPKVAMMAKPAAKVCGGLVVFDTVVGDHFGLYDFGNACAYDANYLCVTKIIGQDIPYDPPAWGKSRSALRIIFESPGLSSEEKTEVVKKALELVKGGSFDPKGG